MKSKVVITAAASTGLMSMEEETDNLKLWQPQDSEYVRNSMWLRDNFPSNTSESSILILSDNVLEPDVIKKTFLLLQKIQAIKLSDTQEAIWKNICRRNPVTDKCMELSVLEAFQKPKSYEYDIAKIENLSTLQEVKDEIQKAMRNGKFKPCSYLGSIQDGDKRNTCDIGNGAKAMLLNLVAAIKGNDEKAVNKSRENNAEFQRLLVETVNNFTKSEGLTAYPFTIGSFADLIGGSVLSVRVLSGYLLIFVYVLVNLGKLNSVEQRAWLSIAGIIAVVLGIVTSFGLAAHLGFFYSKMDQILPFLMLGVGIDDMFVIAQAFDDLSPEERNLSLAKRIGRTMMHAGVAITITSVTDLLAFGIGATTALPALGGFCIYASLGIFFIYFYAITFFLAWFSIDQRRAEDIRDGCFCVKKENWRPNQFSQNSLLYIGFDQLSKILVAKLSKITVVVTTLGILVGGICGAATMDTFFDPNTFLDKGTYLRNYLEYNKVHFPDGGFTGQGAKIFFSEVDYFADMEKICNFLKDMEHLVTRKKIWFEDFIDFVNTERREEFGSKTLPQNKEYKNTSFQEDLTKFLQNPQNQFRQDMIVDKNSSRILLSFMPYQHPPFEGSNQGIKAMKEVFAAVKKYQFTGNVFATSRAYDPYLTTDIITSELFKNILMALGVVFICTLVLIADFVTSVIVLLTVTLTIVNVAGYANFWGLNIDPLFAIFMTISIGLCVDYSAHIAHAFMVSTGSRDDRMRQTLTGMGPAVLNGGISTFLAFVLLSTSNSVIFLTFFKVFFLVVVFGLFHGLIFLPVVLSLLGPPSLSDSGYSRMPSRFLSRTNSIPLNSPILKPQYSID